MGLGFRGGPQARDGGTGAESLSFDLQLDHPTCWRGRRALKSGGKFTGVGDGLAMDAIGPGKRGKIWIDDIGRVR